MKSIHIYNRFQVSYLTIGDGKNIVIAFPGIALDASSYESVIQTFKKTHQFYILDLFYAGESKINGNHPTQITPTEWNELLKDFIASKKIDTFSLWGFSIGARIAMISYSNFENQIQQLVLLAPDGIVVNKWYAFATRTFIGHGLFKRACHSKSVRKMLIFMARKLSDQRAFLRIESFLIEPESLRKIYLQWMTYRDIQPKQPEFEALATFDNMLVLLATKDEFIKGLDENKVKKKLPTAQVINVNDSHLFLNSRTAKILKPEIKA